MTTNPDALSARLATLREEKARGEEMLANLDREARTLREQLLRIDGAIRVLEELGAENAGSAAGEET